MENGRILATLLYNISSRSQRNKRVENSNYYKNQRALFTSLAVRHEAHWSIYKEQCTRNDATSDASAQWGKWINASKSWVCIAARSQTKYRRCPITWRNFNFYRQYQILSGVRLICFDANERRVVISNLAEEVGSHKKFCLVGGYLLQLTTKSTLKRLPRSNKFVKFAMEKWRHGQITFNCDALKTLNVDLAKWSQRTKNLTYLVSVDRRILGKKFPPS